MERIKYDYYRYNMFALPITLMAILYSIYVTGKSALYVVPFFLGLLAFINLIIFLREKRKSETIYFSEAGLLFEDNKQEVSLKWENVRVSARFMALNDMDVIFYTPTLEKKVKINNFHGKSIVHIVKKFCPPGHDFYRIVEEYARRKALDF